jgi:hypothetical protein
MKTTHQTQPLGVIQPQGKNACHQLKIILKGQDQSTWSTEFTFDVTPSAPRRFLILELTARVGMPDAEMNQHSDTHSVLTVHLRGSAAAQLKDLSAIPIQNWIATLYTCFAQVQASIGILVTHGRVSVILNGGD